MVAFENKGAMAATVVVAASDSLNKAAANYVCDGVADNVEIQAAINALPAGGGKVLLLEGTYNCAATITLKSHTYLCGEGWNSIIFQVAGTNATVLENVTLGGGDHDIHVSDLQIDGNGLNNPALANKGFIKFWSVTDISIERVYAHDMRYAGALLNVGFGFSICTRVKVLNCYIYKTGDYGIATDGCTFMDICGNLVIDPASHFLGVGEGATAVRPSKINIKDNVFFADADGLASLNGIKLQNVDDSQISGNKIIILNDNGLFGIVTTPDAASQAQYRDIISNNTLRGFSIGMYIAAAFHTSILDNYIEAYTLALRLTAFGGVACSGVEVNDNYINTDPASVANGDRGITLDSGCTYINIVGNFVWNILNMGIGVADGSYINVSNNMIYKCRRIGIFFGETDGVSYSKIEGNIIVNCCYISNNTHDCIRLDNDCVRNIITDNICYSDEANKPRYCIVEAAACDYNIIKGNKLSTAVSAQMVVRGVHTVVDRTFQQPIALDLSGASIDITTFHASCPCQLIAYEVLYSEASSADAGVNIRIGRYQDGVALDNDYFDISVSEVSKNLGYTKHFITTDLTAWAIAAGDSVTVGTAGGKVGTGEVIVILHIAEMAG